MRVCASPACPAVAACGLRLRTSLSQSFERLKLLPMHGKWSAGTPSCLYRPLAGRGQLQLI